MTRWTVAIVCVLVSALGGGCERRPSAEETIQASERHLRTGSTERALDELLLARVEHPGSARLLYQIGVAQQATATTLSVPGTQRDALRQLTGAAQSFARVDEMRSGLGLAARFNAATLRFQQDGFLTSADRYEERLQNLRQAIALLEALVADAPGFEEAQHNLDYARYHLSLLLQNPPRPPEEEDEGGEDPPPANSAVDAATTQIPKATAEVIDGSTIILRLPGREEETP